ncbi:MAG: hypothetical protein DI551_11220 [Micavibrio aeruginosavorus]|uniref:Uncharacterized protein n=1 Tax=Micavibrio aeruginosavorus TaxID=349221 RepID=A0A2W5MRS4_9BACT|nr:MAG: hypothetical protein DI551_11220 [Micavibrio aeruginosavorus]
MVERWHKMKEVQGKDWEILLSSFGKAVMGPVLGRDVNPLNALRPERYTDRRGVEPKDGYCLWEEDEDVTSVDLAISFNQPADLTKAPENVQVGFSFGTKTFSRVDNEWPLAQLTYVMQ